MTVDKTIKPRPEGTVITMTSYMPFIMVLILKEDLIWVYIICSGLYVCPNFYNRYHLSRFSKELKIC